VLGISASYSVQANGKIALVMVVLKKEVAHGKDTLPWSSTLDGKPSGYSLAMGKGKK